MAENPILESIENLDWLQPVQDKGAELVKNAFTAAGPAGQTAKNALHGVWLGHPLHPAITDVPVGSWTVAAALDLLEMRGDSQYQAGADAAVMLGLLSSIPAALSGITDWSDTHAKPQRVGLVHGILNICAAATYAGSYAARKSDKRELGRVLGFLGYGLVLASAYLGGELSFAQKIGVNHAPDPEGELPKDFTVAVAESALTEGKPTKTTIEGTDIFLLKKGGTIYAMADKCSHLSGPLSEGKVENDSIICPWHGSRFCLKDGRVEDGPATSNQPVLDVKVVNGQVLVKARQN
jgi:nitrite reductase/ring-hydroxylating ferredoxin subunit/uncharacterized membrane protein